MIFIGSILAAIGLEEFLVPDNLIDGGVTGISIMAAYLTKLPLGIFTFFLNIPFLIIGYKQIGRTFVIRSLFAIVTFSLWLTFFQSVTDATSDVLLAAVFGGIFLGLGVGLIIRYGGSLDGTEMIAIVINRRWTISVGQVVMFFNIFILGAAGLLFGWDRAMYSLIAYFIAFKLIDIVVEGIDESKAVLIISEKSREIADTIMARLGRSVTFLQSEGGYSGRKGNVIYVILTRLEISKLKTICHDIDENALITIQSVSDVIGKQHKKAIH
ncbi:MAG: YitT family protein [Defluviitaleaceae bacterium]|nr:YitT family protein [Defluviitaleaceae bacterium]